MRILCVESVKMKLKEDVVVQGLTNEILLAIIVSNDVYRELGHELTITSMLDGRHSNYSSHYAGKAIDIRTRTLTHDEAEKARLMIENRLTTDYQVLLEKDHIHLQYRPWRP